MSLLVSVVPVMNYHILRGKNSQTYYLTVLEVSLKSKMGLFHQGISRMVLPLEAPEKNPVPCLFQLMEAIL